MGVLLLSASAENMTPEVKEKLYAKTSVNFRTAKLSTFADWVRKKTGLEVTVLTDDVTLTGGRYDKLPIVSIIKTTVKKSGLSVGYSKEKGFVFYKKRTDATKPEQPSNRTDNKREFATKKPASETYNVTEYGAKGDGKTDDSRAISEVITKAAGSGATVFFPAGTYLVLDLPVASKITLAGDPKNRAILKLNHRAIEKRGCIIAHTKEEHIDQLVIRDLKFDGDRQNIREGILTQLVNIFFLRDSQILNCEFYNGKGGVILQRNLSNLKLENCTVRDSDSLGFYIQSGKNQPSKNITLINCHSIRNRVAYGIFDVDYLTLKNCTGMYSTEGQIQIDASRHVKYINCVSAYNKGKGFNIMASHFRTGKPPHDILYENCVAHDNGEEGFNMCGASNVTLKNCKSYNNKLAGVSMATVDSLKTGELADSVRITECEIRDNGHEGIVVNGARNCTFSGNRIFGNGLEEAGKYSAISINAADKRSKAKGYLSIGIRIAENDFSKNRQGANPFLVISSDDSEYVTVLSDLISQKQVSLKGPGSQLIPVSAKNVKSKLDEIEKRDTKILCNLPKEKTVTVSETEHEDWFDDRYPGFEGIELRDIKKRMIMKAWKKTGGKRFKQKRDELKKKSAVLKKGSAEREAIENEMKDLIDLKDSTFREKVREIIGDELFRKYLKNLSRERGGSEK